VQKGNSNVTDLPTDEVAVIDHHVYCPGSGCRFEDVRPEAGSCSAIIADYFFENNIVPPRNVATALLYGIYMDTDDLTRGASTLDIDMFYRLYPISDISLIVELRGNEISVEDLGLYADAFKTVEIYDEVGFLRLESANDSLLGAAGDIIVSVAGVNVSVAYARRPKGIKISVRSVTPKANAVDLVQRLVEGVGKGGGHNHMAGGFIPEENLKPLRSIDTFLKHRAISYYESLPAH
jgi:nanoRNase/pAp phosphatase (c-di-AMP/oligoRNAs hydrolase)